MRAMRGKGRTMWGKGKGRGGEVREQENRNGQMRRDSGKLFRWRNGTLQTFLLLWVVLFVLQRWACVEWTMMAGGGGFSGFAGGKGDQWTKHVRDELGVEENAHLRIPMTTRFNDRLGRYM